MKKLTLLVFVFSLAFLNGCREKDPIDPVDEKAPELTRKVNDFIYTIMDDIYLWYDKMPDIDYDYEFDSKEYFEKLLYSEDKWSYITDDIDAMEASFEGTEESFGYSLTFGRFVDNNNQPTGELFAIVEYVYDNTPASKAGFERGDLIIGFNNEAITVDNYADYYYNYSGTLSVTKGELTSSGISQGDKVTMTSQILNLDPVLQYDVITVGANRIGYLFYTQYISKYNSSLDKAFQYFKMEGITDLVLDLRYNPGGGVDAAQHLCSSLAPRDVVEAEKPLVTFRWNDKYQAYWESSSQYKSQIIIPFASNVVINLNLDKLYVLTGRGSASASELTITGLDAYMNVITIGDYTYGKYTASITMKPEDLYNKNNPGNSYYKSKSEFADFDNWGIQPIVIRYANANGVTDFKNGFAPDYSVDDELLPAYPLGTLSEPLFKKAVELITGEQIVAKKSAIVAPEYKVIDRGFSRFDENKRNMPIDKILKDKNFLIKE